MPVQLLISEGNMQTSFNGNLVDSKQYKAVYDGEKGKMLMRDNNEGLYVEMDNDDLIERILFIFIGFLKHNLDNLCFLSFIFSNI